MGNRKYNGEMGSLSKNCELYFDMNKLSPDQLLPTSHEIINTELELVHMGTRDNEFGIYNIIYKGHLVTSSQVHVLACKEVDPTGPGWLELLYRKQRSRTQLQVDVI